MIGSKVIKVVLEGAKTGKAPEALEAFCREISLKGQERRPLGRAKVTHNGDAEGQPSPVLPIPATDPMEKDTMQVKTKGRLPSRFGMFGGAYVPESLVDCLDELETAYYEASNDPAFWKEFEDMYGYMNRPSELYLAERLTEETNGAKIWLK